MRKLACLAAVLVLAACNDSATETPAADDAAVAEAAPAEAVAMSPDGKPAIGKYKVTGADGTTYDYDVRADGTFTSVVSTGETVTGTWTQATPDRWCETVDGKEACYTEAVDAEGKWTATSDADQSVATVVRVEG